MLNRLSNTMMLDLNKEWMLLPYDINSAFNDISTGFTPTTAIDDCFTDYSKLENLQTPTPLGMETDNYFVYPPISNQKGSRYMESSQTLLINRINNSYDSEQPCYLKPIETDNMPKIVYTDIKPQYYNLEPKLSNQYNNDNSNRHKIVNNNSNLDKMNTNTNPTIIASTVCTTNSNNLILTDFSSQRTVTCSETFNPIPFDSSHNIIKINHNNITTATTTTTTTTTTTNNNNNNNNEIWSLNELYSQSTIPATPPVYTTLTTTTSPLSSSSSSVNGYKPIGISSSYSWDQYDIKMLNMNQPNNYPMESNTQTNSHSLPTCTVPIFNELNDTDYEYSHKSQSSSSSSSSSSSLSSSSYPDKCVIKCEQINDEKLENYQFPITININNKSNTRSKTTKLHDYEKPFICDVVNCNKRFVRIDELKRHQRTHSGVKQFVCDTCNKGFTRSDHLMTHRRTHTGERPYPCKFCERRFARSDECNRHMKTHLREKPRRGRKPRNTINLSLSSANTTTITSAIVSNNVNNNSNNTNFPIYSVHPCYSLKLEDSSTCVYS